MDVDLDTAFAEACKALGEALVTQRLLGQRLAVVEAENEQLRKQS